MMKQPTFKEAKHFKNFWEKGNGKELAEWSGAQLSFKNFDRFSPLHSQCDELADHAVQELLDLKKSFPETMALLARASQKPAGSNKELSPALKKLLLQIQNEPDWVDWDLLEKGASLCRRSGLSSLIVLRDYCLMGGYDYSYLNKPLIYTGALKKGAAKRLGDTLDFWVNVTREDALKPFQKGVQFCLTTRIIHSYSRIMILKKFPDWETDEWGLPINTWDMLATYLGFSLVFLHGLKKLEMTYTPEEEAGLFHLWKYIGTLIGIPVKYLPDNKKQATESFYLWTSIQPPSDSDSSLLAKSLLRETLESDVFTFMFQRKTLYSLHVSMNWFLLDKEVNKRLKIPRNRIGKTFANMVIFRNKTTQKLLSRKKQISMGHKFQMDVLNDYLKHHPK